jgi:hypothetical protein
MERFVVGLQLSYFDDTRRPVIVTSRTGEIIKDVSISQGAAFARSTVPAIVYNDH